MEVFFQTEIPPWVLLVLIAVMTAIYFYVLGKDPGEIVSEPDRKPAAATPAVAAAHTAPAAPAAAPVQTAPNFKKIAIITAAAKMVIDKRKSAREQDA